MATLTVWRFDSPGGADEASQTLQELARENLVVLHDAATVTWEQGKKKPKTRQLASTTGAGALGGTFWGLLFGMIFFVPLLGAAIGAATGALAGSLNDVGIDDSFINKVRDQVTPGTSALFVMSSDAVRRQGARGLRRPPTRRAPLHQPQHTSRKTALRDVFAE